MAGSTTSDALRWSARRDKPELPEKSLDPDAATAVAAAAAADDAALGRGGWRGSEGCSLIAVIARSYSFITCTSAGLGSVVDTCSVS